MLLELLLGSVTALLVVYYYFICKFNYWQSRGIRSMPSHVIVGSMGRVISMREHLSDFYQRAYDEAAGEPYIGYFLGGRPGLIVRDQDLIKKIIVKDFSHFMDHSSQPADEEVNPMQAKNLFNMTGRNWKEMRTKLSPTFTSGRMKAMFPLVLECAEVLEKYIGTLADTDKFVDIKDLLARYTTDVIGTCAFGIKCDSIHDPNCHFRMMGRKILETNWWLAAKQILFRFAPKLSKSLRLKLMNDELVDYFRAMVRDVMRQRSHTGEIRKDFIQLLLELKEKGLTDDDITAQALVFFFAGFETSSSTLTFALFELARRPELQRNARQHIEEVLQRHEGELTYQALHDMTYLDWILQESLRMYPPLAFLLRVCTYDYVLPGTDIILESGLRVVIPIRAMQNDPNFFPEPNMFNPERFKSEQQINQYIYMPFGEGPRQCIGMRFAYVQSKLGLLAMLRSFEVQPDENIQYPLTWNTRQFLLVSKDDIRLKFKSIS